MTAANCPPDPEPILDTEPVVHPITCERAAQLRAICETRIQRLLMQLAVDTRLDLERVEVFHVAKGRPDDSGPHVIPMAVKITLAV